MDRSDFTLSDFLCDGDDERTDEDCAATRVLGSSWPDDDFADEGADEVYVHHYEEEGKP